MQHRHHLGSIEYRATAYCDDRFAALSPDHHFALLDLVKGGIWEYTVEYREFYLLLGQCFFYAIEDAGATEKIVSHQNDLFVAQNGDLFTQGQRRIWALEYDGGIAWQQKHQEFDENGSEFEIENFQGDCSDNYLRWSG